MAVLTVAVGSIVKTVAPLRVRELPRIVLRTDKLFTGPTRMDNSPGKLQALDLEILAREPGTYSDGGGLQLTVRSLTSRSWVLYYTASIPG